MNGKQQWTVEELSAIAGLLSMSLPELMRGMGYKSPEQHGNEIVGRIAGNAQVSTITDKRGLMFPESLSSDEKVLIIDDAENPDLAEWHGGAVFYQQIDVGLMVNVMAIIEAPGMLLPVVGSLHGEPGDYTIRPLACKLAHIEGVASVLRMQPVTRLVMPPRRPPQPVSRGK